MTRISVIMPTYNGEKYIKEQINSILSNITSDDEIIISDDGSTDKTVDIIHEYEKNNANIKYIEGPHQGVVKNINNALKYATGNIIFLSDQDDVWLKNKVATIVNIFENNKDITCVLHDLQIVDANLSIIEISYFNFHKSRLGFLNNLIRNSFVGAAMAFRASMLEYILPIENVPMHDQWIGLINEVYGKTFICNEILGLYRRHGANVTQLKHGSLTSMLSKRMLITLQILKRFNQILFGRKK
ncbi:glycosyltransferase family 2 protein [Bifidobacterium olomucense]|uniref:Family 2 glucosyltransferase n=1 Tax=Bifidobacterium olomucense TaxID=2675324 RepID=A0A7Y0EZT1_9BIFI|nr:glycosyltransferase family 2 protein [Bifidobacterium sp. DSM 109959]NMM99395.1 family 2 glucosyltransferase [Bifidobacterium sp. DSM 109959]